jgi:hypothetical protein
MKSVMKNTAPFLIALPLVGLAWWLQSGSWMAGVVVTGTIAVAALGMGIWSAIKARHRRRS